MADNFELLYYGTETKNKDNYTDITKHVIKVDKLTSSGTGEINSAVVTLDAKFGRFVKTAPIINQYDLFLLRIKNLAGNIIYQKFLIQDDISPQKNDEGTYVILDLLGRERYLQKITYTGHYHFASYRQIITDIFAYYNKNKGSNQPTINNPDYDTDSFPAHTYGVFDFSDNTSCYDALLEVVNRLKVPTAGGGDGRFYVLNFEGEIIDYVVTRILPVGNRTSTKILENPVTLTQIKKPMQGNVVVVKGKAGSGSLPKEPALFRSLIEEYENIPAWQTGTYKKGTYVHFFNKIYRANADTSNLPARSGWTVTSFEQYVKDQTGSTDFQYSPWTQDKAGPFKNMASNPNSFFANAVPRNKNAFDSVCYADSNLVIRDATAWRTWVDFVADSLSDIPSQYLYPSTRTITSVQDRIYRGMRVLVGASPRAPFNTRDRFNVSYANNIAQYDGDEWIVMRQAQQFDEVAVLSTGKIYEYNTPPSNFGSGADSVRSKVRNSFTSSRNLAWRDTSELPMANDCFHYPNKINNVAGLIGENASSVVSLTKANGTKYTDNSGIQIEYTFGETNAIEDLVTELYKTDIAMILTDFLNFGKDANDGLDYSNLDKATFNELYKVNMYQDGWWCPILHIPYPKNTFNSISENVGQLYGGTTGNKKTTLDVYNLNETPSGQTSYVATDADELGTLTGIKFLINFNISGIDIDALRGDIPLRCVIYDLEDNVWISDSEIRFQNETYELEFPFSSFKIYRARRGAGWGIADQLSRIINPELKVIEVFEPRSIKMISIHTLLTHDDQGRYDPFAWEFFLRKLFTISSSLAVKFTGTIDAVHLTKTPYAIAKDGHTNLHIDAPIKDYPNISNVAQLQKIANAELDLAKFRAEEWEMAYAEPVQVNPGDKIKIKDSDFGDQTLIVKKVTYSIDSEGHYSGLITKIQLYKEVTA